MQVSQKGTNSVTLSRHRGVTEMEPASSCHVLSRPSLSVTTFRLQVWGLWAGSGLGFSAREIARPGPSLPGLACRNSPAAESRRAWRRHWGHLRSPPRWQTLRSRAHTVSSASLSHREGHSWPAHPVTRDEPAPDGRRSPRNPAETSTIRCLGLGDCREQTTAKPGRGTTG